MISQASTQVTSLRQPVPYRSYSRRGYLLLSYKAIHYGYNHQTGYGNSFATIYKYFCSRCEITVMLKAFNCQSGCFSKFTKTCENLCHKDSSHRSQFLKRRQHISECHRTSEHNLLNAILKFAFGRWQSVLRVKYQHF